MTTRQALWTVIGVSTLVRLAVAASVGDLIDEAYYSVYARHLDWSYFDHPPMVGLVAAAGETLAGWISPVLGLRFGYIVMFAGSSWLLARLTERFFGARAAVLAVVVLNSTIFFGVIVGSFAGPDGPLLFFWLLTMDRLAAALDTSGRTWTWFGVGLAWGAAMLSKYHAILLPVGIVLYLLVRPSALRCLRTPGPYVATLAGLAVFSPVLIWNARHGWVSFLFQGKRSAGFQGFRLDSFTEMMVGQIAYLFPWLWLCLVAVLFGLIRRGPRRWSDAEAFLTCQALPALALFMGVATYSRIMTHWPLIGFVALMPMLGRALSDQLDAWPVLMRFWLTSVVASPIVLAVLFVAHANYGLLQDGQGRLAGIFPPRDDPTVDTIRWGQIARELKRRGLSDAPNTFLFTDNWNYSAKLALATGHHVPVTCYHPDSRGFTYWSSPADWIGRDGIFVRVTDALAEGEYYSPWFTRIEPLADFPVTRAGFTMQTVRLFRCVRQTDPFPLGYSGPGPVPVPAPSLARKSSPGAADRGVRSFTR